MKYQLLLVFALLFSFQWSHAQVDSIKTVMPFDKETDLYTYSEVVQVPKMSGAKIISHVHVFARKRSVSIREIESLDSLTMAFLVKLPVKYTVGLGQLETKYTAKIEFDVIVQAKEGRYKYTINRILVDALDGRRSVEVFVGHTPEANGYSFMANSRSKNKYAMVLQSHKEINKFIKELEVAIAGYRDSDDNW